MIKIYKFQVNTKKTSTCISYAYIDKTKRNKLDNKAEQCVFLSASTNIQKDIQYTSTEETLRNFVWIFAESNV